MYMYLYCDKHGMGQIHVHVIMYNVICTQCGLLSVYSLTSMHMYTVDIVCVQGGP